MMQPELTDPASTDLLTALPDCVLVLDGSGRVLWGNKAAERLFGRALRDSIGYEALELVHADDLELVLRSLESVRGKAIGTFIEVRVRTPSGWRLLEVVGTPVSWPTEPTAVLFCMRDLTERRRFEVAHSKDAVFRAVVQNSPDITMLLSPSGVVESVSAALTRSLGHDPEVVEGRAIADFVHDEDRTTFDAVLQAAARGATASRPARARIRLTRRDGGAPVPFEFVLVNLLDDRSVAGFIACAHDISARVAAEKARYQSEQRFRQIFDQGPLGVVLTDFEHRITDVNDVFCRLLERPSATLVGSLFPSLVHPDDRARAREVEFQLVEESTLSHKMTTRFESSSRDVVFASVTASAIHDENGVPIHCLWIIEDVTQRRLLERELIGHAATASRLLASLTSRETEILDLLGETASAGQIANRLTLSVRTVESHLANAYRKLGVHTRAEAEAEFARLQRAIASVRRYDAFEGGSPSVP